MVKIGRTSTSGEARRADYVRTHKLNGEWSLRRRNGASSRRGQVAEREIHAKLKTLRFSSKAREVFACSESEALSAINRFI